MNNVLSYLFTVFLVVPLSLHSQEAERMPIGFWEPADSFHKNRFYTTLGAGVLGYSATMYGLSTAWYKDSESNRFHFYNDLGEWRNIDKYGHAYTAYMETDLLHRMGKWTGLSDKKSLYLAAGAANVFQLSIEIFDGFNEKWGFSGWDIAFNAGGSLTYMTQELLWNEQRIRLKYSVFPQSYSNEIVPSLAHNGLQTYEERTTELYGEGIASRLLKDYNGQTYWLSVNPASFNIPHPDWLNWAVGVGAKNIYGGFSNEWETENAHYLSPLSRKTIFYLSPDINWDALKGNSHFLNTILHLLNYLKTPAPAVSIDSRGNLRWHLLFF